MGQLDRDLPDFRQLSFAERSKLAEAIWESFVAAHPESLSKTSTQAQEFARPEVEDHHAGAAQSWAAARAERLGPTRSTRSTQKH